MDERLRARFALTHPGIVLLDAEDPAGVERYLVARSLLSKGELPSRIERAGAGNMNLTLRVSVRGRSLIVKQERPWVEKYSDIDAPWGRTLVEGQFYEAVRGVRGVSDHMPELLALDEQNHVLVLADAGPGGDLTSIYADHRIAQTILDELLEWLKALGRVIAPEASRERFANRAMRELNHEHMFRLPLADPNGLDLDRITDGLGRAATKLKSDRVYALRVHELGEAYLGDGATLVHGDYFPGSWVKGAERICIIDPEFGFLGAREFDYGVMLGHLALAFADVTAARQVVDASGREGLDERSVLGFAGVEIMRRLIGVAQLPLVSDLDAKARLLEVSRSLVLEPERGLTCW